jgi:hypothetical protein
VKLEPEGLRFHDSVTLTVTPASGSEAVPAAGFGSSEGGDEFHHHPLVLDPKVLALELLHFSEDLVYYGDDIHIPIAPEGFVPTDWESQLVHLAEELIRNERNAVLRGEEGDPEFSEKIETLMRAFFDKVVEPLLPRIARDCDFAKANIGKALNWARQAALLVGEGAKVISISQQLELLGAGEGYNPYDPALDCQVDTWVGTASQTNTGRSSPSRSWPRSPGGSTRSTQPAPLPSSTFPTER